MTQPYCVILAPLLVVDTSSADSALPNQRIVKSHLEFYDSDTAHDVAVRVYSPNPPSPDEVVSYWGNVAHDGNPNSILTIFATSVETYPWAKIDGESYC